MTPEERKLLEENNKILRGMRRSARFTTLWRIIYWSIIIILTYGAYVKIEPYIKPLMNTWESIQKDISALKNATSKIPSIPSITR